MVKFSIKDELNVADLSYTDLLVAVGHRLYEEGKGWISKTLEDDLDKWSAEVSQVTTKTDEAEAKVEAGIGAWFLKATGMLKTGFADKKEFRRTFEPRVPQLIEFINRIIAAIETNPDAGGREVLVILEDLDKPTVDIALDLFAVKGSVLVEPRVQNHLHRSDRLALFGAVQRGHAELQQTISPAQFQNQGEERRAERDRLE